MYTCLNNKLYMYISLFFTYTQTTKILSVFSVTKILSVFSVTKILSVFSVTKNY